MQNKSYLYTLIISLLLLSNPAYSAHGNSWLAAAGAGAMSALQAGARLVKKHKKTTALVCAAGAIALYPKIRRLSPAYRFLEYQAEYPDRNAVVLNALQKNDVAVVRYMYENDHFEIPDKHRLYPTFLHFIAQKFFPITSINAQAIVAAGQAHVNTLDRNQCSPLLFAACYGHDHLAHELLAHGANPHVANILYTTPLMHTVTRAASDPVTLKLLAAGANVNACDNTNRSALTIAASSRNFNAVKLLMRHGASLNHYYRIVDFYTTLQLEAISIDEPLHQSLVAGAQERQALVKAQLDISVPSEKISTDLKKVICAYECSIPDPLTKEGFKRRRQLRAHEDNQKRHLRKSAQASLVDPTNLPNADPIGLAAMEL